MIYFLAKNRKGDLVALAYEMNVEISPADRIVDICKKIQKSPDFEEETAQNILEVIIKERSAKLEADARKQALETETRKQELEAEICREEAQQKF